MMILMKIKKEYEKTQEILRQQELQNKLDNEKINQELLKMKDANEKREQEINMQKQKRELEFNQKIFIMNQEFQKKMEESNQEFQRKIKESDQLRQKKEEEEKVSPEEIEAMDAKNAGIIDGYNRKLNKEIKSAIDSGTPLEELKKLREEYKIPGPVERMSEEHIREFIRANELLVRERSASELIKALSNAMTILGTDETVELCKKVLNVRG